MNTKLAFMCLVKYCSIDVYRDGPSSDQYSIPVIFLSINYCTRFVKTRLFFYNLEIEISQLKIHVQQFYHFQQYYRNSSLKMTKNTTSVDWKLKASEVNNMVYHMNNILMQLYKKILLYSAMIYK